MDHLQVVATQCLEELDCQQVEVAQHLEEISQRERVVLAKVGELRAQVEHAWEDTKRVVGLSSSPPRQ